MPKKSVNTKIKAPKKPAKKKSKKIEISQPVINIGLVGHVDHGKTTLVSRLSGKWTDTHSEERKRGITIRLGYANATFYKCPKCEDPECYGSKVKCPKCGETTIKLRTVSFVDAPGHETLMATMLSGSAIMDYAILMVAANESCPQPQTKEHLMALDICGIKNIIIAQNKIDLVSEEDAIKNYKEIKEFVKGTIAEKAPIVPISAQGEANIDLLIKAIEENFPTPNRDLDKNPVMFVIRSFDVNKPGTKIANIVGGVLGGAIILGKLKVGDKIEIKPGRKKEKNGKVHWDTITTDVSGIMTGNDSVGEAMPGGSIALLTNLDPSIVKSDALAGNLVGKVGTLPGTLNEIDLELKLLERVVGTEKELNVDPIRKGEALMLNVNASVTTGVVTALSKNAVHIVLKRPICAKKEDRVTISRLLGHRFRLIGFGLIK
ncbi:MAG: translation initiation factor IF-2 subunit gamma [archaeon]